MIETIFSIGEAIQDVDSDKEADIDESLKNKYEYSLKFVRTRFIFRYNIHMRRTNTSFMSCMNDFCIP